MNFPFITNTKIDAEAARLKAAALSAEALRAPWVDVEAIVFDYLCDRDELSVELDAELPDEDGDEVLGKTTVHPGRIQISRYLTPRSGRFRFTLAHEVGHWVLHRPLILAAEEQPGLFGDQRQLGMPASLNRSLLDPRPPREEIQANRFAASLLIDHDMLRREFLARFGHDTARALGETGTLRASPREQARALATYGPAPDLAEVFGVSVEAMGIAIESRKYLPGHGTLFDK